MASLNLTKDGCLKLKEAASRRLRFEAISQSTPSEGAIKRVGSAPKLLNSPETDDLEVCFKELAKGKAASRRPL
jgi:hypothetical protein